MGQQVQSREALFHLRSRCMQLQKKGPGKSNKLCNWVANLDQLDINHLGTSLGPHQAVPQVVVCRPPEVPP